MAAFFIIPVSLSSTEITMIMLVILLLFVVRKFPGLWLNICKGVQNFKDELKDDK
ncbi:MAG: twin-arginine translocase TatA/TatE family subunit [Bacteroidaceae bacterium]|nr:twin-arginine translocase TatA/TatE family subunit [Bacteroidaceae bacterium]